MAPACVDQQAPSPAYVAFARLTAENQIEIYEP